MTSITVLFDIMAVPITP